MFGGVFDMKSLIRNGYIQNGKINSIIAYIRN